jgi:hypothetical protein
MRLSVGSLRQVVKRDLPIEFVSQQLTSYGGLELFRRYVRRLALPRRLRTACATLGGDYSGAHLGLLVLALLYVGARRLEHLRYLAGDPLVRRFCGLAAFFREVIDAVRVRLGRGRPLEFRMDAAFFQRDVLRLLAARGCAYAIKVGYWSWLPLKQLAAERRQWHPLAPDVTGFEHQLEIPQWNLRLRVMIYRKHVRHESPKNFQLDLFTPDDGHFEYYAVATNMALTLPALYAFIGGRGAQEKTLAELKGEFALDVVPTKHYGANSAWQQLSILAYNVARSFQLDTGAAPRHRSRKRTYRYVLRSMRTLRASCLSSGRGGWPAFMAGRCCGSRRTRRPRPCTRESLNTLPLDLFSDWGLTRLPSSIHERLEAHLKWTVTPPRCDSSIRRRTCRMRHSPLPTPPAT